MFVTAALLSNKKRRMRLFLNGRRAWRWYFTLLSALGDRSNDAKRPRRRVRRRCVSWCNLRRSVEGAMFWRCLCQHGVHAAAPMPPYIFVGRRSVCIRLFGYNKLHSMCVYRIAGSMHYTANINWSEWFEVEEVQLDERLVLNTFTTERTKLETQDLVEFIFILHVKHKQVHTMIFTARCYARVHSAECELCWCTTSVWLSRFGILSKRLNESSKLFQRILCPSFSLLWT